MLSPTPLDLTIVFGTSMMGRCTFLTQHFCFDSKYFELERPIRTTTLNSDMKCNEEKTLFIQKFVCF